MTLGSLEYVVIGFEGGISDDRFTGEIAREIEKVVANKTIRLVDVVLLAKTADGTTAVVELDNQTNPRFASFAPFISDRLGLFTHADLSSLALALPHDSIALALLFEHRWAEQLKEAIQAAGGFLVARDTVPVDVVDEVARELETAGLVEVG